MIDRLNYRGFVAGILVRIDSNLIQSKSGFFPALMHGKIGKIHEGRKNIKIANFCIIKVAKNDR